MKEQLEKIGLRVPQITKIMRSLYDRGIPVDPGALTVDEAIDALVPLGATLLPVALWPDGTSGMVAR